VSAEVYPSKAMLPGVEVYQGHQAGCTAEECGEENAVYMPPWVRWWGDFHENWIDAKLEAVTHNIEKHPRPQPSWEEIIHGRQDADVVHSLRTH